MPAMSLGRFLVWLFASLILWLLSCLSFPSMAREVEKIVMRNGAVPATIGILRGQIHVGLTDEELQFLASSKNVVKVSRRDLPYVLSQVWYADFLLWCFQYSNRLVSSFKPGSFKPRWDTTRIQSQNISESGNSRPEIGLLKSHSGLAG